jgi:cell shape-determining protein MreC
MPPIVDGNRLSRLGSACGRFRLGAAEGDAEGPEGSEDGPVEPDARDEGTRVAEGDETVTGEVAGVDWAGVPVATVEPQPASTTAARAAHSNVEV